MQKWRSILLLMIIGLPMKIAAQQFGGNPPSLKWRQVNTDTVRIIFPSGLEKQALDITILVHKVAAITQHTIGDNLRKVNIVLQSQPTIANGYVTLGPFRSEFYLTPRQNSFELGSLPWHKTLGLHEYRHVQQFNNFRKGLSKAFNIVFGEEGQALANSIAIPDWFWEGDAVYQETFLSDQGRGRLPYFFNYYRSLWASRKNYSWMKLRNGSYRDLVPDHYHLGYMLVAYGYEKYGENSWRKITDDAVRFKGLIYPFQNSLKRHTGQSFKSFTNETFDFFKVSAKPAVTTDAVAEYAMHHDHFVADEQFPDWIDSSNLLYVKSSYKKIPAFYIRNTTSGTEKKISTKAVSSDDYFSYRNGRIVYSAFKPDARWGWRNYEVINVLDISTGKERKLTRKTRYQSPDISEDGNRIVAVHADPSGKNELHLLDASDGSIISAIPNPQGYVFTYPKFYNNENVVSAVRNKVGQMALGIFNLNTGEAEWLTGFSMKVIGFPRITKDTVSFTMAEGSQDKLFAAIRGKVYRFHPSLPNTNTGNYQLTIRDGKYAWTSFTAVGYHTFNGTGYFEEVYTINAENNFYPLKRLQHYYNLINDTVAIRYPISKYSQSFRLFNFHSWRPYISDPEYSYSLISENILNTLRSEIFITYNRNENFKETGASMAFGGWFPIIKGGASYTFDRSFRDSVHVINWNEFNALAGLSIPLSFANGSYYQNLTLSGTINSKQVYYTGISKSSFNDIRFSYAEWSVAATNQQLKARQNIYPRFAQTIFTKYRHILNIYSAYQLLMNGSLYLPGIFPNHSLVLQASYQQRDTLQQYTFTNSFPFSRGYSNLDFPRMWKLGVNYHFPILYPDIGFANILYLLRMRANIFYDYTKTKSLRTGREFPFSTVGTELYFDTQWWNQLPVTIGIRYSRLLDNDIAGLSPNQWEIVLPVNLLSR